MKFRPLYYCSMLIFISALSHNLSAVLPTLQELKNQMLILIAFQKCKEECRYYTSPAQDSNGNSALRNCHADCKSAKEEQEKKLIYDPRQEKREQTRRTQATGPSQPPYMPPA